MHVAARTVAYVRVSSDVCQLGQGKDDGDDAVCVDEYSMQGTDGVQSADGDRDGDFETHGDDYVENGTNDYFNGNNHSDAFGVAD